MDNKYIHNNFYDLDRNKVYLTNLSAYKAGSGDALIYTDKFILQEYITDIYKDYPDVAALIVQLFTIPIKISKQGLWQISHNNLEAIKENIANTEQNLLDVLNWQEKDKDEMYYRNRIDETVVDLKNIVKEYCWDKNAIFSFNTEVDELKKSLDFFLNKDISVDIQLYEEEWRTIETHPIVRQVSFLNKRIDRFLQHQPNFIRDILLRRQDGHMNDIEDYALQYRSKKYPTQESDILVDNTEGEQVNIDKESNYNNAIESLRTAVFKLNAIFYFPEDGTNKPVEKSILNLFQKILQYIGSLHYKLEDQKEFNEVTKRLNIYIAWFLNQSYSYITSNDERLAIVGNIFQSFAQPIYDGVNQVLQYKTYKNYQKEYKFIKPILVKIQESYKNADTVSSWLKDEFKKICELEWNFVTSLSPEELSELEIMAMYYEEYDLLHKINNLKGKQ